MTHAIIFTGLIISCNQSAHVKPYNKTIAFSKNKYVDTSIVAIIPFKEFGRFVFDSTYKADSLTQSDFIQIDSLLTACITNYNNSLTKDNSNFHISSADYRQYVAAINNNHEKEVWINCFCDTHNIDWKKSVVIVEDGGSCYYRLKINLTRKKYYDLSVNGEA